MAIYSMNGSSSNRAFDYNATVKEEAYNRNGSNVYTIPYSRNNMVSYYRNSVETLSLQIQIESQNNLEHILFITDPHGTGTDKNGDKNFQNSQTCALYLLNNAPISMLVLGGDYCISGWVDTEFDTYMDKYVNSNQKSKIYALMGNHETYNNGSTAAKQKIYTTFLANKSLAQNSNPQEIYYYFDKQDLKTRYMFINTSDGGSAKAQYVMTDTQISWIKQNVILPDKTWSLLVFGHVNLSNMGVPTFDNETNGSEILDAIKLCNGTIIGYICGHQHIDAIYKTSNIWQTTLLCDKCENYSYYTSYSHNGDRIGGTDTEQAITLITIDRKNSYVRFRRIGSGSDKNKPFPIGNTLNYTY